jgi:hypothetical protein
MEMFSLLSFFFKSENNLLTWSETFYKWRLRY